jgi:hypothetical protein
MASVVVRPSAASGSRTLILAEADVPSLLPVRALRASVEEDRAWETMWLERSPAAILVPSRTSDSTAATGRVEKHEDESRRHPDRCSGLLRDHSLGGVRGFTGPPGLSGANHPVAVGSPVSGVQIGLEALCATDWLNPNVEDRFVHVIAHEYAHVQQVATLVDDENPTVLSMSLIEGAAEFIAELISGKVSNSRLWESTTGLDIASSSRTTSMPTTSAGPCARSCR